MKEKNMEGKKKIILKELDLIEGDGKYNFIMQEFLEDEEYRELFFNAPASTRYHHSYPGGLYDHTLEVFYAARNICELFPELNSEVALTGAMLHDIGKIFSYTLNNPTKRGTRIPAQKYQRESMIKCIGDIGETLRIVDRIYTSHFIDKNVQLFGYDEVLHIIASHHGEVRRGWGSLVNPATPEAQVVHFADMISSRVRTSVPDDVDWLGVFTDFYPEIFKKDEKVD